MQSASRARAAGKGRDVGVYLHPGGVCAVCGRCALAGRDREEERQLVSWHFWGVRGGGWRWMVARLPAHLGFFVLPFACPAPSELSFASSGWSRLLSLPVTAAGEYVVGGMWFGKCVSIATCMIYVFIKLYFFCRSSYLIILDWLQMSAYVVQQ